MWKLGDNRHPLLRRAESDGYPNMGFETWYQQGMRCYQAALPKRLRKQALRALAARWLVAGCKVEMWHLRAFVYGVHGLDAKGRRDRLVSGNYEWPTPPDASWLLIVCCYPDGEVDLDFAHPVSRRFWSEDNGFLALPDEHAIHFNKSWYEQMGFEVMVMMPVAREDTSTARKHLRVIKQN